MSKVLIVAAHPDDEVLGCGGTSARLTGEGHMVTACILVAEAAARQGRHEVSELHDDIREAQQRLGCAEPILGSFPNIELNTVSHLDLVRFVEAAIRETGAEVIFTHHPADLNDDHGQTSRACQAAARLFQRQPDVDPLRGLFYMEVLSSTDWSLAGAHDRFVPDTFVEIREEGLEAKLKALAAYRGVMRPYPHPRSAEAIRALASHRGAQARMHQAEAFQSAFLDLTLVI